MASERDPHPATTSDSAPTSPDLCVVLVHGAWHGGWCWSALQSELDQLAIASYAIDLPGRGASTTRPAGLVGDAEAVIDLLDHLVAQRPERKVILVGHSYGGAVVSAAAARHSSVAAAVFVAAYALNADESVNSFLRNSPRHSVGIGRFMDRRADGSVVLQSVDSDGDGGLDVASIYAGVDARVAAACVARLSSQPADTFTDPVMSTPFGAVPTTYIVCNTDDAVHPIHQRMMAQRCDRTVELDSGHFPMLSTPTELAATIAASLPHDG